MTNAFKMLKSQEISKSNDINNKDNDILLKSDSKKNQNQDNKNKSIYLDKEKENEKESQENKTNIKNNNIKNNNIKNNNNKNNNTKSAYYRTIQNNDTENYNNIVREKKEINNEYNKTEQIITKCKTSGTSKHYTIILK